MDQCWSINDQLSIFVTDSESAENLEAEFISDADHDQARVFTELPSNWSEIDQYTIDFVIWCEIEVKINRQQFSVILITNLALSWL